MGAQKSTFRDHLEAAISLEKIKITASIPSVNQVASHVNAQIVTTLPLWILLNPPRKSDFSAKKQSATVYKTAKTASKAKFKEPNSDILTEKKPIQNAAPPTKPAEPMIELKQLSSSANVILLSWQKQGLLKIDNDSIQLSQIKRAFRKLALKYHPDRAPNVAEAKDKFIAAQKEFEILKKDLKKVNS
jgi:hypothetical protein